MIRRLQDRTKSNQKVAIILFIFFLSQRVIASNYYVDKNVQSFPTKIESSDEIFELISHGAPGLLLLDGKWRNADEIASFLKNQAGFAAVKHLNIYGCEFAKGAAGAAAIA